MAQAVYTLELWDFNSETFLSDITHIASKKTGTYRLNRPASWSFDVPCDQPEVYVNYGGRPKLTKGRRLKVRRTSSTGQTSLIFNGPLMTVNRVGAKDLATASCVAADPMIWWAARYMRDSSGNYALPAFRVDATHPNGWSGGDIVKTAVGSSIFYDGPMGLATSNSVGRFDLSVPPARNLSVEFSNFPLKLSDMVTVLTQTGEVDVVIVPTENAGIETDPGAANPNIPGIGPAGSGPVPIMGNLNAVNQWGRDLAGVHFDYGLGDFSIDNISYTEDLTTLANKIRFLLGAKVTPERWKGSIEATNTDFPISWTDWTTTVQRMVASRQLWGIWMDIQAYDGGYENLARELFQALWLTDLKLRVGGRELLRVTPIAGAPFLPFENYGLGDVVRVNAEQTLLGIGLNNVSQRIYGFDVNPDDDGVERVGELIASADAE